MSKVVFISQPMNGRPDSEVAAEREVNIQKLDKIFGERIEVVDSFFMEDSPRMDHPIRMLGRSITLMADADIAYFVHGWSEARGCRIEHEVALAYGVPIMYEAPDPLTENNEEDLKGEN